MNLDRTHDPNLRSWIEAANQPGTDFPIQNLPFGVFRRPGMQAAGIGVAIADQILNLTACVAAGLLHDLPQPLHSACLAPTLNPLMALDSELRLRLRHHLSDLLQDSRYQSLADQILIPITEAELLPPATIGDYTDFYASIFHATNIGKLFRPDNPLLPNYKYTPIAYHGRASSVVVSGTPIQRPQGQWKLLDESVPQFGPTRSLDYELEVGMFVAQGNALGQAITINDADAYIFGLCLVNDWSARDIQAWEYQPLGPFLAKSFATTLSPWVVTLEALAPFRCPAFQRDPNDPQPLPYLTLTQPEQGGIDLQLQVLLSSAQMREQGLEPISISQGAFREMYWTVTQMLTHHASNGCNLRPGDLLASGTVSGPTPDSQGCLLEMTQRGAHPLQLPTGETRSFLADGDEVILYGYCERPGFTRIGFGECRGVVLSAAED